MLNVRTCALPLAGAAGVAQQLTVGSADATPTSPDEADLPGRYHRGG